MTSGNDNERKLHAFFVGDDSDLGDDDTGQAIWETITESPLN